MRRALLLKAAAEEGDEDDYAKELSLLGVACHVVPTLSFEFMNLTELAAKLQRIDEYSGIILSSPRCVEALKRCSGPALDGATGFTVGDKTRREAEKLGLKCSGSDSGSGKALTDHIMELNLTKPLLLPEGSLARDTIPTLLQGHGLQIDQITVYKTQPNPQLEAVLGQILKEQEIDYILFFSPSGVEFSHSILKNLNLNFNRVKFGAIGPTTKQALEERSVSVSFVPEKPTPELYAKALQMIL